MARRYLAIIEARLGVKFPDSYSAVFRTQKVSRFPLGELWAPTDAHWDEDRPELTTMVIGMFQRGDARPLVMLRANKEQAELGPELYVLQGDEPELVASSLQAAMKMREIQ